MGTETVNTSEPGMLLSQQYIRWKPYGNPTVTPYPAVVHSVTRVSTRTPNFRKRDPKTSLPMNYFSFTRKDEVKMFSSYRQIQNDYGDGMSYSGVFTGSVGEPPTPDANEMARLQSLAKSRLFSKLKDGKINLAQAYAERKQTANLIASTATRIAGCMTSLRKGNLVQAADHLGIKASKRAARRYRYGFHRDQQKAVANQWLELQYGWKPLLQDVYGAAELLAQHAFREIQGRAVGSATARYKSSSTSEMLGQFPNSSGGRDKVTNWIETQMTCKYVCWYSVDNELQRTVAQVGISNPALLAWELLPWSFVVDWFIPIGNYLESLDATSGMKFNRGCFTTFFRGTSQTVRTGTGQFVSYVRALGTTTGSVSLIQCVRTPLGSFPAASLPQFKNPLSFTHAANAIALLRSTFKR